MKRLDINISRSLDRELMDIAESAGISREDVLRRGLAVLKAFRQQRSKGRKHLGFVSDPRKLDAEIVNVL